MPSIKVGSDFSGIGSFNQSLNRLGIDYEEVFACDMNIYARKTFIHNYGEPKYYPKNVYDRVIPKEPLDIYMASPPCQSFSLAGKRLGKKDKRGILFFKSYELIKVNKPRYFIFENVKGLLSDNNGKTFSEWLNLLGGKSVNANTVLFPYNDSLPYHIYWKILNAKDYGVPQNRERVFIVGIRDDKDNNFSFPKEQVLTKSIKDILEDNVDDKYYLSDNIVGVLSKNITKTEDIIVHNIPEIVKVRKHNIDTFALQKLLNEHKNKSIKKISEELKVNKTEVEHWFRKDKCFSIPKPQIWYKLKEVLEIKTTEFDLQVTEFIEKESVFEKSNRVYDENGISPTLTRTSADERIIVYDRKYDLVNDEKYKNNLPNYRIRRLTPRECFRLMDFPDTFDFSIVSETQAYKQSGSSIVVNVLYNILKKLSLRNDK